MEEKFPYLEHIYPGMEALKKRPSPRFIKTHIPYHLLPTSVRQGRGKASDGFHDFTKLFISNEVTHSVFNIM